MKLRHLVGGRLYYYYYYYYYCCWYDTLLWCLPIVPSSRSIPEWNMTGKIEIVATFIQLYGDKCGPLDMDQAWEWRGGHGSSATISLYIQKSCKSMASLKTYKLSPLSTTTLLGNCHRFSSGFWWQSQKLRSVQLHKKCKMLFCELWTLLELSDNTDAS